MALDGQIANRPIWTIYISYMCMSSISVEVVYSLFEARSSGTLRKTTKSHEFAKSLANFRNQPPPGPGSGVHYLVRLAAGRCRDAIRYPSPPVRIKSHTQYKTFCPPPPSLFPSSTQKRKDGCSVQGNIITMGKCSRRRTRSCIRQYLRLSS